MLANTRNERYTVLVAIKQHTQASIYMQNFNIAFINNTSATVQYNTATTAQQFASEYKLTQHTATDIGGLTVYTRNNTVTAVYDYENMRGWFV